MAAFTYTKGQEDGFRMFCEWYMHLTETIMLLKGYSGTGKSTLVQRMIEHVSTLDEMLRTIDTDHEPYEVILSATTNQAAESLAIACGGKYEVRTVHSVLGLRLETVDYKKGTKELRATLTEKVRKKLLIVDEVSYIDKVLLSHIFNETEECKILLIGDPAQLTPVGSKYMPAFNLKQRTIELTEPVRFEEGPLAELIHELRACVLGGPYPNFSNYKAANVVEKLPPDEFKQRIFDAFTPEAPWGNAKVLAFSNDRVTAYNNWLSSQFLGDSVPKVGQRMFANETAINGASRVNNNTEVVVTSVVEAKRFGCPGWELELANKGETVWFLPMTRQAKKTALNIARQDNDWNAMREITDEWVDLRPAFSCTVNKSQGSTYDYVFIDLADLLRKIRDNDQLARSLYVGVSRARKGAFFCGDVKGY